MIHPPRPKVKGMLKVGALLVVVALILFIWANVRPVPIRLQVTFEGFANLDESHTPSPAQFDFIATTNQLTLAYFCVSNAGNCSVVEEGAYWYEITNKPVDVVYFQDGPLVVLRELKPGGSMTISLPTPWPNTEPWRVGLSFSKVDWRYRLIQKPSHVGVIKDFVYRRWSAHRLRLQVYSDWLKGPELVPAATNTVKTPPE
jgi:hypothetical protein